ncbi:MAG: hypothetical protein KDA37_15320 [Planctomycetales bacterium]|nr:hypothetical protein [Planctomycetales bacterium]
MCKGISILKARLKQELFEHYELASRVVMRDGGDQEELHFMFPDPVVQLPVEWDGQTTILEWGNRGNKESRLPRTGWCREESLKAGKWRWLRPEPVVIPADFGLEKGVWFLINEGIQGVVVRDEQQRPHVYMLTTQASTYYQNMTRHDRMPVLVDQVI